jgi:hypothetical protein
MLVYIDVSQPRIKLEGCLLQDSDGLEVIAVDFALLLYVKANCCEETTPLNDLFSC